MTEIIGVRDSDLPLKSSFSMGDELTLIVGATANERVDFPTLQTVLLAGLDDEVADQEERIRDLEQELPPPSENPVSVDSLFVQYASTSLLPTINMQQEVVRFPLNLLPGYLDPHSEDDYPSVYFNGILQYALIAEMESSYTRYAFGYASIRVLDSTLYGTTISGTDSGIDLQPEEDRWTMPRIEYDFSAGYFVIPITLALYEGLYEVTNAEVTGLVEAIGRVEWVAPPATNYQIVFDAGIQSDHTGSMQRYIGFTRNSTYGILHATDPGYYDSVTLSDLRLFAPAEEVDTGLMGEGWVYLADPLPATDAVIDGPTHLPGPFVGHHNENEDFGPIGWLFDTEINSLTASDDLRYYTGTVVATLGSRSFTYRVLGELMPAT